jgi:CRP/FNR family cyclic AMP-dependent transcriptional regulator
MARRSPRRSAFPILEWVEDRVAILRGAPLFSDLDERSLHAVAILAREVTFTAGDTLIAEGDAGEAFYVIVDGTVRIEHDDRTIRSMTAGGFLGEIALVGHRPRTATATAVTEVRALELQSHEFNRLLESLPAVHARVLAAIERRGRTAG